MLDGVKGQEDWLKETIKRLDTTDFWQQDRKIYKFKSAESSSWTIGGYYRQVGNFTFIVVPKQGHFSAADNYPVTQSFLEDYVDYGILKCHDDETHCRVHHKMCSHMKNCNGHGTCNQYGFCECAPFYKGGDCSYNAITNDVAYNVDKLTYGH